MKKKNEYRERRNEIFRYAEACAQSAGVKAPPVDPMLLCKDDPDIVVRQMELGGECDGILRFAGNRFYLFYNPDPHRGRFNLSHELGHYLIEEHNEAIRYGDAEHVSQAGFLSDNKMEKEADWFAAGLLMPGYLFGHPDPNFKRIQEISGRFAVSLTAAAIRAVSRCETNTALILVKDGLIKWVVLSEGLAWSGTHKLKKDCAPPRKSKTAAVISDLSAYKPEPISAGTTFASDWFENSYRDPELWEEIFPQPNFNQALVLLTQEDDLDDEEE